MGAYHTMEKLETIVVIPKPRSVVITKTALVAAWNIPYADMMATAIRSTKKTKKRNAESTIKPQKQKNFAKELLLANTRS